MICSQSMTRNVWFRRLLFCASIFSFHSFFRLFFWQYNWMRAVTPNWAALHSLSVGRKTSKDAQIVGIVQICKHFWLNFKKKTHAERSHKYKHTKESHLAEWLVLLVWFFANKNTLNKSMAKRENLSFALVTWTMIKRIHVFNILNSIFTHILHLCATSYFRWCNGKCSATFLFVCLFLFCFSAQTKQFTQRKHSLATALLALFFWFDIPLQITCIFVPFMHAHGMLGLKSEKWTKEKEEKYRPMSKQNLIEIFMKLMRFMWHSNCWNNWQ